MPSYFERFFPRCSFYRYRTLFVSQETCKNLGRCKNKSKNRIRNYYVYIYIYIFFFFLLFLFASQIHISCSVQYTRRKRFGPTKSPDKPNLHVTNTRPVVASQTCPCVAKCDWVPKELTSSDKKPAYTFIN